MAGKKKSGYDGKIAGLYDLEATIGHGHFAVVKLARHVFTGEKVAVKVIDKQKLDEVSRAHLFQEVRCMKLVQHPHVVRLYEVIDTQTKLYLILELGDGDMYDYIMKHDKGLDEALATKYFRQIVEAILYCHRLHVVHRDLKPENVVFFNKLGIVKLTDFGFSNVFAPGKKLETSCGSLAYSAPEILLGDSYDPPAVDVWSLGVILFMLVTGRAPFQEANDSETLTMIMDCKYQIPTHVSRACQELIAKMLVREPGERIGLEEIERDPWLVSDAREEGMKINLPLLSREHVSEEDHNYVVQKMVEGKICTREEIFQSLERDAYDHIAATYYLLIERRLRKLQHHEAAMVQTIQPKQPSSSSVIANSKPHLEPLMLSPRAQSTSSEHLDSSSLVQSLLSPLGTHPSPASTSPISTYLTSEAVFAAVRKCSLILEEIQDVADDDDDDDGGDFQVDSVELKPSKSLECLDERTLELSASASQELGLSPASGTGCLDIVKHHHPLKSVSSSPQLLNQIREDESEHGECLSTNLAVSQGHYLHGKTATAEVLAKYDRMKQQRRASCDASKSEDTGREHRGDKLKTTLMQRCDTSGHSSDADGPTPEFGIGGIIYSRHGVGASNTSHFISGCSTGGGSGREEGAIIDTGKRKKCDKTPCDNLHNQCEKSYSSDTTFDEPPTLDGHVVQPVTSSTCVGAECEYSGDHSPSKGNNSNRSELLVRPDAFRTYNTEVPMIPEAAQDLQTRTPVPAADESVARNRESSTALSNNNNNVISLNNSLATGGVSSTPALYTAHYNGQYPSHRRDLAPVTNSVEFSEISDYCDCMDDQAKVTMCLGDCGLPSSSHQSPRQGHVKQNGVASSLCKVGTGSSVVQIESKCCSVV
ncbi:hypothetical protein BsWGS_22577 [Bradybaena similaris]